MGLFQIDASTCAKGKYRHFILSATNAKRLYPVSFLSPHALLVIKCTLYPLIVPFPVHFHSLFDTVSMPLLLCLPKSKQKEDVSYATVEIDPNRSDTDVSAQLLTVAGWSTAPRADFEHPTVDNWRFFAAPTVYSFHRYEAL